MAKTSLFERLRSRFVNSLVGPSGVQMLSQEALLTGQKAPLDPGDFSFGPAPMYIQGGATRVTAQFRKNFKTVTGAALINDIFHYSDRRTSAVSGLYLSLGFNTREVPLDPITNSAALVVNVNSPCIGIIVTVSKSEELKRIAKFAVSQAGVPATRFEFTINNKTDTTEVFIPFTTALQDGTANALGIAGSVNETMREVRVLDKIAVFFESWNCDCFITPVYFQTPAGAYAASLLAMGNSEAQLSYIVEGNTDGLTSQNISDVYWQTFFGLAKDPSILPSYDVASW